MIWSGIPPLLAAHVTLSLVALAVALAIGLPLAIAASSRPRLAAVALAIAGIVQTIPGLALLALMVPILANLGLSPFGFSPAVVALTLYALLPILRNAITGLRGVDPAALDAARGMGMSPAQVLRRVQLPLAAPVIAAGVRTATVWTVGAATLATPVGQACLGNYIFTGLQTRNFPMLLAGVGTAAALALALDGLLAATEHALAHRGRTWLPATGFVALVAILVGILPRVTAPAHATVAHAETHAAARVDHVTLAGKVFTEQYILVELMRRRLEAAGVAVSVASSLGSTVIFDALARGDVDAYVDYTGTLWATQLHRTENPARWAILAELDGWLAHQKIRALPPLGFENTYALAVRRETATRAHLATVADLAPLAPTLALGGDYELFGRPEWAAVQQTYGLDFHRTATFDPALLYEALARGEVDVIAAFSSDGRIAANDLVVLADPAGALPPYDALVLLGPRAAADSRVACVLGALHVTVAQMREANARVDRDGQTPADAAAWLDAQLGAAPACP